MMIYKHEKLTNHLYRIVDMTGVCCYLAIGDDRACLLDTCNGIGNIKEYVATITDKPLFVILTHGHLDHMGGAALFDEVYMNHNDLPVFKNHSDMSFRVSNTNAMTGLNLTEDDYVKSYTGEFKDIKDGDTFDLGNLTIKMILVKGHTPGMMCPLIVEDRVIIFGDACGVGVLLFDEFSSCVSEYKASLEYLKKYENDYDTIYRNHGTFFSNKVLLDNVIECCDLILKHEDDHVPVTIHGIELFAAKQPEGHGRKDGKEGNIMYAADKAK